MSIRIALVGNPNTGKTTLFNSLTGAQQYVGNWPGVTVERKEGRIKGHPDALLQDLPGVYSLSPYTAEELITRDYLLSGRPDAILNIVDASNLERNLYLSTQLMELGIPMLIALNMMDTVAKEGDRLDTQQLSQRLGIPVLPICALRGEGLPALTAAACHLAAAGSAPRLPPVFHGPVADALTHIGEAIGDRAQGQHAARWHAVKLFERDEAVQRALYLSAGTRDRIEAAILGCEEQLDDDSESIITDQRYAFIQGLMRACVHKGRARGSLSPSDHVDRIVTNRWLGFPIFMAVMFLVYFVSVTTVGTLLTDFTNETLFGEWIIGGLSAWLPAMGVSPWLTDLLTEGIAGGVGAVLGFVPQMFVLFFFLAILEDIGYMARVAFIMDRIFRKFGLSGKSFIPMLIGSGCSVPGIMASRTIENQRDRRMTIMTTSFIPCGAKIPIVALVAGALFGGSWWVAPSAYFVGVAAVIISGVILKKTRMFAGTAAPFVMELPAYHLPSPRNVLGSMWERGFSFIKRAGTIILLSAVVLWFLKAYGWVDGRIQMVEDMDHSILAFLGNLIAPIFRPLGFGTWQSTVATTMGLVAKEEVVSVFGVLYGVGEGALDFVEAGNFGRLAPMATHFTALSGFSFLIFNLLCAPCFAAIGAIRREMNSARWTLFAVGYLMVFAYVVSFIIFQLGTMIGSGFAPVHLIAIALLLGLLFLIFRRNPYTKLEGATVQ